MIRRPWGGVLPGAPHRGTNCRGGSGRARVGDRPPPPPPPPPADGCVGRAITLATAAALVASLAVLAFAKTGDQGGDDQHRSGHVGSRRGTGSWDHDRGTHSQRERRGTADIPDDEIDGHSEGTRR